MGRYTPSGRSCITASLNHLQVPPRHQHGRTTNLTARAVAEEQRRKNMVALRTYPEIAVTENQCNPGFNTSVLQKGHQAGTQTSGQEELHSPGRAVTQASGQEDMHSPGRAVTRGGDVWRAAPRA